MSCQYAFSNEVWLYETSKQTIVFILSQNTTAKMGGAVASWLRHHATNRQVAGSVPDVVIGIFQLHNASGRTMVLGSTQRITEMSTRCISLEVKAAGA
jgi:hypothetical protein